MFQIRGFGQAKNILLIKSCPPQVINSHYQILLSMYILWKNSTSLEKIILFWWQVPRGFSRHPIIFFVKVTCFHVVQDEEFVSMLKKKIFFASLPVLAGHLWDSSGQNGQVDVAANFFSWSSWLPWVNRLSPVPVSCQQTSSSTLQTTAGYEGITCIPVSGYKLRKVTTV